MVSEPGCEPSFSVPGLDSHAGQGLKLGSPPVLTPGVVRDSSRARFLWRCLAALLGWARALGYTGTRPGLRWGSRGSQGSSGIPGSGLGG